MDVLWPDLDPEAARATAPFPRGLLLMATFRDPITPAVVRLRDSLLAAGTAMEIGLDGLTRSEIDDIVIHVRGGRPDRKSSTWCGS